VDQSPRIRVLLEYDVGRAFLRWPIALLLALFLVLGQHGFSRSPRWVDPVSCNGGWFEAMAFLGGLISAMVIVEVLHWAFWRVQHWDEVMSLGQKDALLGRGTDASLGTELFQRSSGGSAPGDYDLQLSGGKLALAPANQIGGMLLGFALLILGFGIGTANPCEVPAIDWRTVVGWFVIAYALLMIGTGMEYEVKRRSKL
jgi:hypothetical protein